MPELDGQVALVTGGGRGIGANIARELAAAGARVAVSARTKDEVEPDFGLGDCLYFYVGHACPTRSLHQLLL